MSDPCDVMKRGGSDKGKGKEEDDGADEDDSDVFGLQLAEEEDDDDYHVAQDLTRRHAKKASRRLGTSDGIDDDGEEEGDLEDDNDVDDEAEGMVEQEVRRSIRINFDDLEWARCTTADFENFRRLPYPLAGQPIGFGDCKCFADFFLCFFPLSFWANAYLCTVRNQLAAQKEVFKRRKLITWREFFTSIGVLVYVGLHSIRGDKMDMWSTDPLLGAPVIGQQRAVLANPCAAAPK